jgi:hypothetical protein
LPTRNVRKSGHIARREGIILADINFEICQLKDGGVMGNNVMDLSEVSFYDGIYVYGAGSGSCFLASFHTGGAEPSDSATRELM